MPGKERHRILPRVAMLLDKHREELALIETPEGGKPIANTDGEIQASIDNWECGATLARHMYGDTYDSLEDGRMGLVFREPVGVIGMITPWNYRLGDPFDPATQIGPVISKAQLDRILGYVEAGKEAGAKAQMAPFQKPELAEKGYYMRPTMFTDVTPGMKIEQEEIFGPVLSVIPFDTPEEAIRIANGTNFGLYGGVWTQDIDKAFQVVRKMRAGVVEVNGYQNGAPELPLPAHKESGLGHEKGRYALDEYCEMKLVQLSLRTV